MTISEDQRKAKEVEEYLTSRKLYYGTRPSSSGNASWGIALNNFVISKKQSDELHNNTELIKNFHETCSKLMRLALQEGVNDPGLMRLRKYLASGAPKSLINLWERAAKSQQEVFSTRPDLVLDEEGAFHVIEYNVDGGADKGNTLGINKYAEKISDKKVVGHGLEYLFIDQIRRSKEKPYLLIATVVPDNYRLEYEAQNKYFASEATVYGKLYGMEWITVRLSDLVINQSSIQVVHDGKVKNIDVIDREFKLPGFLPNSEYDFAKEITLLNVALSGHVDLLGSILPFQDKILLSLLFDPSFESAFTKENLNSLRRLHAETAVLDKANPFVHLDKDYTHDELRNLDTNIGLVLKRGGDSVGSTGSKGLVISKDVPLEEWKTMFDVALNEPSEGGSYWIIQKYYQSASLPVKFIKNSRSLPKELEAITRIAPYYVRHQDTFRLGNVLVTAGTDRETRVKRWANIHGLRRNTYQAVSVSEL